MVINFLWEIVQVFEQEISIVKRILPVLQEYNNFCDHLEAASRTSSVLCDLDTVRN